jgi:hypothetical protein
MPSFERQGGAGSAAVKRQRRAQGIRELALGS